MIETKALQNSGFDLVFKNENFKCAFISASSMYSYGEVYEMKRHNKTDEIFVLISGKATMLTIENDSFVETELSTNNTYIVGKGTWHYLAVSDGAVVFVCENADTCADNTDIKKVSYLLN